MNSDLKVNQSYPQSLEVNLSAFITEQFHQDFSSCLRRNTPVVYNVLNNQHAIHTVGRGEGLDHMHYFGSGKGWWRGRPEVVCIYAQIN